MTIEFHPEATKRFNERAKNLLLCLLPPKFQKEKRSSFRDDIVTHEIKEEDILSFGPGREVDYTGRTVSMFFKYENQNIGLFEEDFAKLLKLSEDIQKSGNLTEKVSTEFIYESIFGWMKDKYIGKMQEEMIDFFVKKCLEEIRLFEIWVPVAHTIVEEEISIGIVKIKNLTIEVIDKWEKELLSVAKDENHSTSIKKFIEKERKDKQGRSVAVVKIEAEQNRAEKLAFEKVEEALSILRLYSAATIFIDANSHTTIKGRENLEKAECYIIENNCIKKHSSILLSSSEIEWRISKEFIGVIKKRGWNTFNELLLSEQRNSFQEKVLNSFMLFSRSTLMKNIPDKLVYIFSSLESILIKNDTEPIQQNLADRIAFAIARDGQERIRLVKCIKDSYVHRSKFVHHGLRANDINLLNEFIRIATNFLFSLLININNFQNKEEMINAIEKRKYGV